MANFSANQVRQFYAAKAYDTTVSATSDAGTIGAIKKVEDVLGDQVIFFFKGADTVLKSDYIPVKNIGYVKAIAAKDMQIPMKKQKVALNSDVNEGKPVSGQDYVLGINFKGFLSPGDGSQYYKNAAVHVTSEMSNAPLKFYQALEQSLNRAFSREDGATKDSNPYVAFSSDANGLYVEEKPQAWELGTKKARRVMFDLFPGEVYSDGQDVIWGEVSDEESTTKVGNGQQIADLEWFCAGERGDQYRMAGWPHVINTKYLVDPTKEYNVLEIHYAFTDTGVNSYRTEKEIHIVCEDVDVLNQFITELNAQTGLEVAPVEDGEDQENP